MTLPLTPFKSLPPFIRWAGSKRKQIPLLSSFWSPAFNRYVEPFMGSACLFFALNPQTALLSDTNPELITTFLAVRDHPRAVSNRLIKIPRGKRSFYNLRKKAYADLDPIDAAARFLFLNRFCFNGLYRTNNSGCFNVPFAPSGTGGLPSSKELHRASIALKVCSIKNTDFEKTLEQTRKGDFVYLDPPYAVENRRIFRQYGPSSFGLNDLDRLSNCLHKMDANGVKFLLSYAACTEATHFFRFWDRKKIFIQRNIAGFVAHRRLAGEVLISNCFP